MSLSERLRPNIESAPWVVAEVEKLEAENAKLREYLDFCLDDSYEVLNDMMQKYGETYKKERLAYQREKVEAIAKFLGRK